MTKLQYTQLILLWIIIEYIVQIIDDSGSSCRKKRSENQSSCASVFVLVSTQKPDSF